MSKKAKDRGQQNWENLIESLDAAKNPQHKDDTGMVNLVNSLVFAARCAATDHPHWIKAQTATTELVQSIGNMETTTREEVCGIVDYIVKIAELPDISKAAA